MPIKSTAKKSDIQIFNQDFAATFIPVHGSSNGTAKENMEKILSLATSGDIVGGDFNINFLDQANVDTFIKFLDERQLRIDISESMVNDLQPWFKMRSVNSLYSQQLLKNGMPDIFIKDLSFKLIKKNNPDEPSIPANLQVKLTDLQNSRKKLLNKAEQLKTNANFNEASISSLCTELGIVSYHKILQSFGNDHPYTYYFDNDTDTLFFSQNSVQHIAYDFEAHFREGNKVDINDLNELYSNLDNLVYTEMYNLLALRDGITIAKEEINRLTSQEKIVFIREHLKTNRTSSNNDNTFTLFRENIATYFNAILRSKELAAINALLKKPFNLSEKSFITAQLETLLSDKNVSAYSTGIDKIINTIYQALSPNRAKPGEQTIALNGNGFLPFRNSNDELIPLAKIEALQINYQLVILNKLHDQYPTATFVVSMIEADGQEHKCNRIKEAVEKINSEVKKNSTISIVANKSSLFNHQPILENKDISQRQYTFN